MKLRRYQNLILSVFLLLTIAWTVVLYFAKSLKAVFQLWLSTFDFAIVEEAAYRFSRGDLLFLSTRGDHVLADNQKYLQFLFGILNWLHLPQPLSLVLLHTTLGLLSGLLVYFIFRKQGFQFALLMSAVILLHPMLLNMIFDFVHSEILTPLFLLSAYLMWRKRRKIFFAALMGLALLIKEDLAFSVFALAFCYGLSDFLYNKEKLREWKNIYLFLMVSSVFVFLVDLFVVLPIFKEVTCSYLGFPEATKYMLGHQPVNPWYSYIFQSPRPFREALKNIWRWRNLFYLIEACSLLWLWNFRSLFLIAVLPALLLNMLSWADYQTLIYYHYDHAILAILVIGIAEASRRMSLRQNYWRGFLSLGLLIFFGVYFPQKIRMSLFGANRPQFSEAVPSQRYKTLMWLQQNLPPNENIAASYIYTSYLMPPANLIFEFPNPYTRHYFGIYYVCEDWKRSEMPDWLILRHEEKIPQQALPFMAGMAKYSMGEIDIYSKPEKIDRLKKAFAAQPF